MNIKIYDKNFTNFKKTIFITEYFKFILFGMLLKYQN